MVRAWAILLILCTSLAAQNDPAILEIRVVEGEGIAYAIGSRATRGITVQVADETGRPVQGAAVSFQLPADGPSGTFASGTRSEIITTGADGRASAWGMQWNRVPGPVEVRITAAKGLARAGTVCGLYLTNALAPAEPLNVARPPSRGHGKIWIGVGVAAAAFVGIAAVTGRSNPGTGTAAGVNAPQIGTPTIIIGRP